MTSSTDAPRPGIRPAGDTGMRFRVLPFRIVVAGRFGLEPGRLHRLDAGGVEALLERTRPQLKLRVGDTLRADGTPLVADLVFAHRRDFEPAAIVRAVPELAQEPAARVAAREPSAGAPAASAGGERRPAAAGAADDDPLDRLLGMVDTPGQAAPPADQDAARAAVGSFIAGITRRPPAAATGPGRHAPAEAAASEDLARVLQDPAFRALERCWAALRFMLRRIDRGSAVTVDVAEAGDDGVAEILEPLVPEDDPDTAGPVRLIVDLGDYDASDRDIGRLRRLAGLGASRRAVVLANAAPGFAGDGGPRALAGMHDPETLFEQARYAGWRTLRDDEVSAWLGLCLTRIALRDAAQFGQTRVGGALDAGASPAVAALCAAAAAASDWPCAAGTAVPPTIDNLVLVEDSEAGFDGPLLPAPSAAAADSLASAGLIALVAERGRDTARLLRLPSVRRTAGRGDGGASLSHRLFQAQVVHGLQWNADRLFGGEDAATIRHHVDSYLAALLSTSGPGGAAEVRLERDDDGLPILAVHARSGSAAAPGASIAFDIPLAPPTPQPDGSG